MSGFAKPVMLRAQASTNLQTFRGALTNASKQSRRVSGNSLSTRAAATPLTEEEAAVGPTQQAQQLEALLNDDNIYRVGVPNASGDEPARDIATLRPLNSWQPQSAPSSSRGSFSLIDTSTWGLPQVTLSNSVKGMLFLNLGALLFGSNQVAIKMAEVDMPVSALNVLRFGIAAACFAPSISKGLKDPKLRTAALELGLFLFGGYTTQAWGLSFTSAARGAFTGTFTVIAVPILVGLSGREVSWKTWTAAVVALLGVGLLTTSGADPNVGDALCILSAIIFGVHKWRSESVTAQFSSDTSELIAVQLLVLALASAVMCIPGSVSLLHDSSPKEIVEALQGLPWPGLIYMGLGTTAFTLWIEMHALKDVSSPLAALIYTAEPLWGALFAWCLLGERWGSAGWVGAALIVSASLGAQLASSKEQAKELKSE